MIVELGHFTLILAALVAVLQMVLPMFGAHKNNGALMASGITLSVAQLALVSFSFLALTYAFVVSDFSLLLVFQNSHSLKPMLYKISGVWGNHEGSMLLWIVILALFGACAALFGGNLPTRLRARVIAVQGSVGVAFYAFVLLTSNPFTRLANPPLNGSDLNPLLQDPGLAFHPPFLYLGYVGLSMTFSFAVAALIEGRVDAAWGRWVRPWTLAAWTFLSIGIALGSWWAYYELGWGGFWFWDPVENASFMPWLIATALLHSAIVVEKREALKSWTVLLAILAFAFSLIGTFIVRSGVLTSVHAFASDPERGVFILAILVVFIGGALTLYAARANVLEAKGVFGLQSRETGLVANNILLTVACFVVFFGTIWPLIAELFFDRKLSVGPPFFDAAFTPFMVILALILPVGAILPWKRARITRALRQLRMVFALAIAIGALVWAMQSGKSALGPVAVFLGVWLVAGAVVDLMLRSGRGDISTRMGRGCRLPRADWGKAVAHAGMGLTIFGIGAMTAWQIEDIRVAMPNTPYEVAGYEVELVGLARADGPNFEALQGKITMKKNGNLVATLYPERRYYPVADMATTEAGIQQSIMRDLYLVVGERQESGGWTVRTFIKPFANWIWLGAIIMALGGVLSLTDRRYRVAATSRRVKATGVAAE